MNDPIDPNDLEAFVKWICIGIAVFVVLWAFS